jgi:hypothetical protein
MDYRLRPGDRGGDAPQQHWAKQGEGAAAAAGGKDLMNVLRSIRSVRLSQDRHDSGSSKDYFVSSEAGAIGHVRLIYREPHEGAWPVMKVPVGAVLEVPPLEAHEGPLSRIHQDENGGVTCVLPSYARSQTKMLPSMS